MALRPATPSASSDVSFTFDTYLSSSDSETRLKDEHYGEEVDVASLPSPPTSWLSAKDMKIFGAAPLISSTDIGIVRCKECQKPVLKSAFTEHAGTFVLITVRDATTSIVTTENCKRIRLGVPNKKMGKTKFLESDAGALDSSYFMFVPLEFTQRRWFKEGKETQNR